MVKNLNEERPYCLSMHESSTAHAMPASATPISDDPNLHHKPTNRELRKVILRMIDAEREAIHLFSQWENATESQPERRILHCLTHEELKSANELKKTFNLMKNEEP